MLSIGKLTGWPMAPLLPGSVSSGLRLSMDHQCPARPRSHLLQLPIADLIIAASQFHVRDRAVVAAE